MKDIRTFIQEQPLLFDGGMGTYYAARTRSTHRACEWANLTDPGEVEAIHRAYLDAGCAAIKTNTFAVSRLTFPAQRCVEVLEAGYDIACRAAGDSAYVFADIGPIEALDDRDLTQEYRFVADCFLKRGARYFLFETQSSDQYLHEVAAHIKAQASDAFIIVSYAVQPDGSVRYVGNPMPLRYVAEMFCDRVAASQTYLGEKYTDSSPLEYYLQGKPGYLMHPDTAAELERMLTTLSEQGEDAAFAYVRRRLAEKT